MKVREVSVKLSESGDGISSADTEVTDAELLFEDDPNFNWFSEDAEKTANNDASHRALKSGPPKITEIRAKSGAPTGDEWLDFFSRVVIRLATDFYIDTAFRDIDENLLTDREVARIKLSDTERDRIAKPFAEFSVKSKFMKKHGRSIVAAAGSLDSIIQLGMWVNRVNRIARRYRKAEHQMSGRRVQPPRFAPARSMPESEPDESGGEEYVSSGQGSQNGRVRPTIAGEVFRDNTG